MGSNRLCHLSPFLSVLPPLLGCLSLFRHCSQPISHLVKAIKIILKAISHLASICHYHGDQRSMKNSSYNLGLSKSSMFGNLVSFLLHTILDSLNHAYLETWYLVSLLLHLLQLTPSCLASFAAEYTISLIHWTKISYQETCHATGESQWSTHLGKAQK